MCINVQMHAEMSISIYVCVCVGRCVSVHFNTYMCRCFMLYAVSVNVRMCNIGYMCLFKRMYA